MRFLSAVLSIGGNGGRQIAWLGSRLDDNGESVNVNHLVFFVIIFRLHPIPLGPTLSAGAFKEPSGTLPILIAALNAANVDHLAVCFRKFDQFAEFGMNVNPIVNGLPGQSGGGRGHTPEVSSHDGFKDNSNSLSGVF